MITAWMLYSIVVGALLAAGGLALEKLLRTHGLPSRGVWAVTIVLSVGWPVGHWAWEKRPEEPPPAALPRAPAPAPPELSRTVLPLQPMVVEVPRESVLRALDGPILVAWGLASGVLLLFFTALCLRTRHLRGQWRKGRVGDETVLFSDEWGPAVVGFLRPQIVLPGWCREVDDWALRFILDHELEHIRTGDLRLMILAGAFPVFFPWHLPVWWQLSRLRAAVEGDCDLRVLGRNPGQTRRYVDLLLDVGERSSRSRAMVAMLSEPYETLKRRIGIMTMPLPKRTWIRGGLLGGGGVVLFALACWAPGPTDEKDQGAEPVAETPAAEAVAQEVVVPEAVAPGAPAPETVVPEDAGAARERAAMPVFTPYTVSPAIRNPEVAVETLRRVYPLELKDAGVGGTVEVWFYVDEEGLVQRTLVNKVSGHRELDDAALKVADVLEFSPALNRDQRRSVWVSLPIEFTTAEGVEGQTTRALPQGGAAGDRAESEATGAQLAANRNAETMASASPGAAAQVAGPTGEVTGVTADAQTGEPIQFVQVFVAGTGCGTLSNREGRFLIQGVPVGEQEVVAVLIGYGSLSEGVTVTEAEPNDVSFALRMAAIPLETLVVRATAGTDEE
jgi:TonB family protein